MLIYITYAVLILITIFMAISASVTSPFGNRKLKLAIGIVIATATVIALSIGGYTQYKYDTASVEKADNIEVVDKKVTIIGWKKTIVKYRGKKYNSLDDDLYKSVKIGEKVKGHVVEGTNKLHDVDGYAVDNERETLDIKKSIS